MRPLFLYQTPAPGYRPAVSALARNISFRPELVQGWGYRHRHYLSSDLRYAVYKTELLILMNQNRSNLNIRLCVE